MANVTNKTLVRMPYREDKPLGLFMLKDSDFRMTEPDTIQIGPLSLTGEKRTMPNGRKVMVGTCQGKEYLIFSDWSVRESA